jgi:hypothetical protein
MEEGKEGKEGKEMPWLAWPLPLRRQPSRREGKEAGHD